MCNFPLQVAPAARRSIAARSTRTAQHRSTQHANLVVLVTCNALLTQLRVEMPSTVVHVNGAPPVNWTRVFLLEYTVLFFIEICR
jgi:hypothetical protein